MCKASQSAKAYRGPNLLTFDQEIERIHSHL